MSTESPTTLPAPTLEDLALQTAGWLDAHAPLHSQGWHLAFALRANVESSRRTASVGAKYVDPCPFCNHSQGHNNASHCLRCDRALPITASVGAGEDTAWPLRDVLDTLIKWADHLRNSHDCDHEGYEVLLAAIDAAQSYRSVGADTGAPLQNLGLEIREINAANGWAVTQAEEFADKYKFPAVLMLIVSEVAEALEA